MTNVPEEEDLQPAATEEAEELQEEDAEEITPEEQIDIDNGESLNNEAAPTDDPSMPDPDDAPFATTDRELRRANKMQLFFLTMGLILLADGIVTLTALPYTLGTPPVMNYLIVFIVLLVATIAVAAVTMQDSARIRNKNARATQAWARAKYGLEVSAKHAHALNKNERHIGMTMGWDKVAFDGYPEGIQIVYAPKRGYRLITTNGENDSELPRARPSRLPAA